MAVTEAGRHRLYRRLEELLGPDEAEVLMEHLPPVGWADVATKQDLDHQSVLFRSELAHRTDQLRAEIQQLRADLFRDQRTHVFAVIGANTVLVSVALALVRFA